MQIPGYQRELIPKLLRTISNRTTVNNKQKIKLSDWPTNSSFTLLNKTSTRPSTRASSATTTPTRKQTQYSQNQENRPQTVKTLSLMSFNRPLTCVGRRTCPPKKKIQYSSINLFNYAKQEKLARLEEQKVSLMNTLYNHEKPVIHRIDEGQDDIDKPNAINFKTYHFMNRLMDIKEQIYQTSNYRPKTSQPLKKTKMSRTALG